MTYKQGDDFPLAKMIDFERMSARAVLAAEVSRNLALLRFVSQVTRASQARAEIAKSALKRIVCPQSSYADLVSLARQSKNLIQTTADDPFLGGEKPAGKTSETGQAISCAAGYSEPVNSSEESFLGRFLCNCGRCPLNCVDELPADEDAFPRGAGVKNFSATNTTDRHLGGCDSTVIPGGVSGAKRRLSPPGSLEDNLCPDRSSDVHLARKRHGLTGLKSNAEPGARIASTLDVLPLQRENRTPFTLNDPALRSPAAQSDSRTGIHFSPGLPAFKREGEAEGASEASRTGIHLRPCSPALKREGKRSFGVSASRNRATVAVRDVLTRARKVVEVIERIPVSIATEPEWQWADLSARELRDDLETKWKLSKAARLEAAGESVSEVIVKRVRVPAEMMVERLGAVLAKLEGIPASPQIHDAWMNARSFTMAFRSDMEWLMEHREDESCPSAQETFSVVERRKGKLSSRHTTGSSFPPKPLSLSGLGSLEKPPSGHAARLFYMTYIGVCYCYAV